MNRMLNSRRPRPDGERQSFCANRVATLVARLATNHHTPADWRPTMLKERMKSVPKKSVSKRGSERRKLKAKKRTERKRTELAPAPADQLAAPSYRARYTPIGEIKVDLGTRGPVIPEMVETLVTSIPVEGLLIPIMVKKEGDDIKLVSGLQRLEAMRILGWQEVLASSSKAARTSQSVCKSLKTLSGKSSRSCRRPTRLRNGST
jgi:hypothetical protein